MLARKIIVAGLLALGATGIALAADSDKRVDEKRIVEKHVVRGHASVEFAAMHNIMGELLSAKNLDFMERAREVAEKVMRPVAAKYDVEQTYPWEVQRAIRDAGLSGVWIPEEFGGAGGSVLDLCLVVEQFSRACGGMGVAYAVNALGSFPILLGGTPEQKQRWLPGIASGDKLIAFGLSEKEAGSDAGSMTTRAEPQTKAITTRFGPPTRRR